MADRTGLPTDLDADDVDSRVDGPDGDAVGVDVGPPAPVPVAADLPTHVPRSVRGLLWQARIGVGLAVLFAVLAGFFYAQASDLRGDAADRTAALEAGRAIARQITTFDGATIDQWVSDTQALATPAFAEEVATLFDPELRAGMAANQLRSEGALTASFVQEIDGDDATVFAVLRQTYTSINLPDGVSDELRMEAELDRVEGRWLVAAVAVLGASTISPLEGAAGAVPADGSVPADPALSDPALSDPALSDPPLSDPPLEPSAPAGDGQ